MGQEADLESPPPLGGADPGARGGGRGRVKYSDLAAVMWPATIPNRPPLS